MASQLEMLDALETGSIQDEMDISRRYPSEQSQLHQGHHRTHRTGLNCEFDKSVDEDLATLEMSCALFHCVQLRHG